MSEANGAVLDKDVQALAVTVGRKLAAFKKELDGVTRESKTLDDLGAAVKQFTDAVVDKKFHITNNVAAPSVSVDNHEVAEALLKFEKAIETLPKPERPVVNVDVEAIVRALEQTAQAMHAVASVCASLEKTCASLDATTMALADMVSRPRKVVGRIGDEEFEITKN